MAKGSGVFASAWHRIAEWLTCGALKPFMEGSFTWIHASTPEHKTPADQASILWWAGQGSTPELFVNALQTLLHKTPLPESTVCVAQDTQHRLHVHLQASQKEALGFWLPHWNRLVMLAQRYGMVWDAPEIRHVRLLSLLCHTTLSPPLFKEPDDVRRPL